MYKDTMKGFQIVSGQLAGIAEQINILDWKLNTLLGLTTTQVNAPLSDCANMQQNFDNLNNPSFSTYSSAYTASQLNCKQCLTYLNNLTNRDVPGVTRLSGNFALKFSSLSNLGLAGADFARRIEVNEFNPTRDLFLRYYQSNNRAFNALLAPPKRINDGRRAIDSAPNRAIFNAGVFQDYYNTLLLEQVGNFFTQFSQLFVLSTGVDFMPMTLTSYLNQSNNDIDRRRRDVTARLQRLLVYVNEALLQQSMMAGTLMMANTYNALTGTDNEKLRLAIMVLKNNKIFAKNFANYLIYNDLIRIKPFNELQRIDSIDDYSSKFYAAQSAISALENLNLMFNWGGYPGVNIRFTRGVQPEHLVLYIRTANSGVLNLPVPDPPFILNNQLV
ncbi:hypothetical protein AHMF7605_03450 [Adhaeribacter arboris]|uniref:Uncharacterized protein n=1 Tax=Adhaeribacter arboris TaxID=2072846 RepID=A0A2T2YAV9_9BACT|nr:hypothetical protein [Adhaeribacter arboris]PSR52647.1 hypothetical protein AHMF7605_03450 [Adhaeribacter arboris]